MYNTKSIMTSVAYALDNDMLTAAFYDDRNIVVEEDVIVIYMDNGQSFCLTVKELE